MSILDIIIRSVSGYVFVVPGIALYFLCLKKLGKPQTTSHKAAVFVFCYYLTGILTMTGIGKLTSFSPNLDLIPFLGMISGPLDTVLNVILFVPLGFFLPMLYGKYSRIGSVAWTGFLFSLSIELVQMFGRGITDINDLITNTLGACIGFWFYDRLAKSRHSELSVKFHADNLRRGIDVLLFWAYAFVIMVTIQPWVIHSLFRLG